MQKKYTVQPNDWLSKVARKQGFRDGGKAIWSANPMVFQDGSQIGKLQTVTGGNPNVLLEGWEFEIPDTHIKELDKGTAQTHKHVLPSNPTNIAICLRNSRGEPMTNDWKYRFEQEGRKMQEGIAAKGKIIISDIDPSIPTAKLMVFQDEVYQAWKSPKETILLDIGGLDPITSGAGGITAIQKMLTNLGYYKGKADGILGPEIGAAIWGFTHNFLRRGKTSGTINEYFCKLLQKEQGVAEGFAKIPKDDRDPKKDRFAPLPDAELSTALDKQGAEFKKNPSPHALLRSMRSRQKISKPGRRNLCLSGNIPT